MQSAKPAITVRRAIEGWAWAVRDAEGAVRAHGVAREQLDAMTRAWSTIRSVMADLGAIYPEIVVDQGRPGR